MEGKVLLKMLTVGALATNCYVLGDEKTGEGLVIDPGGDPQVILAEVRRLNLKIRWVINTHGHFDHILANKDILKATGAQLAIHPADAPMLKVGGGALWFGLVGASSPPPDLLLHEGDKLKLGETELVVIHTPGHSPGSISLHIPSQKLLFDGDLLFNGGIGRYDLPGGNYQTLMNSIREKVLVLDDDTVVYPGHGPPTTIGREKQTNPFLRFYPE